MKIAVFCAKLNIGGAQAFAAAISKYANQSFHFTYVVFGDDVGEYEEDILRRGNNIIHISEPRKNYIGFFSRIVRLMKKEQFDVVHAHTMYNCGLIMLAAQLAGVPGRIAHSHTISDDYERTILRRAYQTVMRALIRRFANEYLACGIEAGNALYGIEFFHKHGMVIRNGIDVEKYRFHAEIREKTRSVLAVNDRFVILHIGHYVKVKNQGFLLQLMNSIREVKPNAVLLLFGEGTEREHLQKMIEQNNLQDVAQLMGNSNDISEILSAGDVFAFPSLYEGTPIALIEAQTNGLPCIISDSIPLDACLLDNIQRISLNSKGDWINAIADAHREKPELAADQIAEKYGTVRTTMETLYVIYEKYDTKKETV